MDTTLRWGRHYVMVRPDHFRVDYRSTRSWIPPTSPTPRWRRQQWDTLVATIESPRRHRRRGRAARRTPRTWSTR